MYFEVLGDVSQQETFATLRKPMAADQQVATGLVICIRNEGYTASLERRKLYQVIVDAEAAKHDQLRVIDESGEDYLYPERYFVRVQLPESVAQAVTEAV